MAEMTRLGAISGVLTATCGVLVVLWGVYAVLTAESASVVLVVARGMYSVGGAGMAVVVLGSIRCPDPDTAVQRYLTWLTFGSFGLIMIGAGIVAL